MRLLALLLLAACASKPEVHLMPDLAHQILVVQKGQKGLTTRRCKLYKEPSVGDQLKGADPTCLEFESISYDLEDAKIREQLRALDFVCRIGNDYYQVTADRPGFETRTFKKDCWLCKAKPILTYIDQSEQERLLNAGTRCYNRMVFVNR